MCCLPRQFLTQMQARAACKAGPWLSKKETKPYCGGCPRMRRSPLGSAQAHWCHNFPNIRKPLSASAKTNRGKHYNDNLARGCGRKKDVSDSAESEAVPARPPRTCSPANSRVGENMRSFPALSSWPVGRRCALANHESAGKRLRGAIRQGSPWLRRMACQCAWAAARTKNT